VRQLWQHMQETAAAAGTTEQGDGVLTRQAEIARDRAIQQQQDADYAVAEETDRARHVAAQAHRVHSQTTEEGEAADLDTIRRARIARFHPSGVG
jgi:hypothetical protein